jgi:hypothetical protein
MWTCTREKETGELRPVKRPISGKRAVYYGRAAAGSPT